MTTHLPTTERQQSSAAQKLPRRNLLQLGGLSLCGLSTSALQRSLAASEQPAPAKSCIFIFLFGGPSHIDLWDMKPDAPLEIRGEFQSIPTNVPGIRLCEHLPHLAGQMDKLCLLRSMTHKMSVHGPACSEVYSGRPYFGAPVTDQALPEDWPSIAAMVNRFHRSESGLPSSVVLPWYTQFVGQDRRIAGQTGGRMGERWNPMLIEGNPVDPDFEVAGVQLPQQVSLGRFRRRMELLHHVEDATPFRAPTARAAILETNQSVARQLVERTQQTNAFSLKDEPDTLRDRYGRTRFGQSLLLARRLVERGIPLVTVNWNDESRFDKVSPHWDTHHQNFSKLKDGLCPIFDRGFATFLADLHDHGLLESTLVVALGEFGRTPNIGVITQNGMTEKTGRDHWPHAFTALVAGGGVRGGQIYGATNSTGGYVDDKPVTPADLSATILQHLGVDPSLTYHDEFQNLTRRMSVGHPVTDLG